MYRQHMFNHLRKPRVLSPLRSLRTCVRNEVDLVPLACKDDVQWIVNFFSQTSQLFLYFSEISMYKSTDFHVDCLHLSVYNRPHILCYGQLILQSFSVMKC